MTLSQFARLCSTLAIQLRATDVDEATIRVYYDTLKDLPLVWVQQAAHEFARSAQWFPKTSDWRQAVATIGRRRMDEYRTQLRQLAEPLCANCGDTGWLLENGRYSRPCACQRLRYEEVTGKRPCPTLILAKPDLARRAATIPEVRRQLKLMQRTPPE